MTYDDINSVRQRLADYLAVESEPTIDVNRLKDDANSILVFQIPDDMDEDEEDEYIELIQRFGEDVQSKILVAPSGIDVSKVAE